MLVAVDGLTHPTKFYAGIVLENNICVDAAPILEWAVGKNRKYLSDYFKKKGYIVTIIKEKQEA